MANDIWNAVVQLRQKVNHKKLFCFWNNKHYAQENTLRIPVLFIY
jgi:hypothetical protein